MTDQTNPEIADETKGTDQADTGNSPDTDQDSAGAEAKKYRLRLRETEAERDALAASVTALRTAHAGRLIEARAVKPEAVWASGVSIDDVLDDNGSVDEEKVVAAIDAAEEKFGALRPAKGTYVPGAGHTPDRAPSAGFADAFKR